MKKSGTAGVSNECQKSVHYFDTNRNAELGFVQSGVHVTAPGYRYGPIVRDHHLIHFVKSGKGKLYINNSVYNVNAGNCFLIHENQVAYYQADKDDPWKYYWLGFCGNLSDKIFDAVGFTYEMLVFPFESDQICDIIMQATEYAHAHNGDSLAIDLKLGAYTREVLHSLLKTNLAKYKAMFGNHEDAVKVMGSGAYSDRYVNIVAKIIQNSYSQNIKIEKIAEKLSVNRTYLSATFKKNTGLSIKDFLTNYRIEQACVMLKDKRKTVNEIANETGYDDPYYFSRIFKKSTGFSPTEYRNKMDKEKSNKQLN